MRDFYLNILGLKKDASPSEIKRAYRKKVFKYHPDKNDSPNAEKMFLLISKAYEELSIIDETPKKVIEEKEPKFSKKYHKKLTQEEIEKHRKLAEIERIKKEEREQNILDITFLELEDSFILKLSNTIGLFSLFLAITLFMDLFILEPKSEIGIAESFTQYYNGQQINIKLNNSDELFVVATSLDDPNFQVIRTHYVVELLKTPILNEIGGLRNFGHRTYKPMRNQLSFYSLFWVIFILFFLPIINFFFKGATTFYIIFVHLNIGFPLIGLLIFFSY